MSCRLQSIMLSDYFHVTIHVTNEGISSRLLWTRGIIIVLLMLCTDQVLVAAVDRQVAQGDGHSSDHLVRVGAQQLHQDGKTLLLTHCGSDVVGPLEGRQRAWCDLFFIILTSNV